MIKISEHSIKFVKPDGSIVEFDTEELQGKIIKSCLSAGIRDIWIAEDISLSIEYALTSEENRKRMFSASDINTLVLKILEGTGYPEVAAAYRRQNSSTDVKLAPDFQLISELISRHLGLSESRLNETTSTVIDSIDMLNIEEAAPSLYIDLAKAFRDRSLFKNDISKIQLPTGKSGGAWILKRDKIIEDLDAATIELINNRIIQLASISELFPAIKIDFRVAAYADFLELDIPLTEMVMIPHFYQIAEAVNDIISSANKLYCLENQLDEADVPVYINVNDMSAFATKKLLSSWPEAAGCCRDMLSFLEEMISFDIFKIIMK